LPFRFRAPAAFEDVEKREVEEGLLLQPAS